jgi:hypothetical protein
VGRNSLDLEIGDDFQGGSVIAIHQQENHGSAGVVLTFSHEDRYVVWTVDPHLKVIDQDQYPVGTYAYSRYVELVAHQLFTHFNQAAPGVTFMVKNSG